ncbi:hypothetical protein E2C01_057020 [Portunus trituberculatus]|uniref:Uncharacterized protein n=1 Tax=Portunus trituberculatus TaxID=210409 RepID=A0A5B7GZ95_PORTR|nr:hypothetical protein [Portunus trituberculatus]
MEGKTEPEKYEMFLEKYDKGVKAYVPKFRVKESKHMWYNATCTKAKKSKDVPWEKLKKQQNEDNRKQ